ncbi:MAG: TIGR00730 family Rossman fold protein [Clostridia bacterium]|nr:TIGR00730 family Rossman fold protein [Clostridia bacterium]
MNICVYGAASSLIDKSYIEAGKELGRRMVERGHGLVFGGGAHGMMGAVAEGVYEKDGYILGIIPAFFEEGGAEVSFKRCSEFIFTETMRERKQLLMDKASAIIMTPGGIGTYDEFFEVLTLKQLGRHNKPIVIYDINDYFKEMDYMMDKSIEKEFITQDCKDLYMMSSDINEILDYIENYDEKDIDLSKVKIR